MTLRREVLPGELVPAGFAVAYADPLRYVFIVYRWPLNHLVAIGRWCYFWAWHSRKSSWDKQLIEARQAGYRQGYADGIKKGIEQEQLRIAQLVVDSMISRDRDKEEAS